MFDMNQEFPIKGIRSELYDYWVGRCTGEREVKITFEEMLYILEESLDYKVD